MKYLLCLLLILNIGGAFGTVSHASICEQSEAIVYFGNGIDTLRKHALYDSQVIEKRLRVSLAESEFQLLQFDLAYNDDEFFKLDLLEATIQDLQTDYSRFWRILGSIEIMPDWFADTMNEKATAVDELALVTNDNLKEHLANYQKNISEGKKILLVAHSQGNFYGNQAYALLDSSEKLSFGMVSIANPDSIVAGDGPYTTLINDAVIWAIIFAKTQAGLSQLPMDPYMQNSLSDLDDIWGHSFRNAYMVKGSNSDQKITNDMVSVLGILTEPYLRLEPGVVTVTLYWNKSTDIDLHVYEPYSSHVYWEESEGLSGFLDRDDRSGYGPEHYTIPSCDKLFPGRYEVALDYFEGDYPTVARVQIEAGLKVRFFEVSMPSEIYGSVNYPVHLAYIRLQENENGDLEFQID